MSHRRLLGVLVASLCVGCSSFQIVKAIQPWAWPGTEAVETDSLTPLLRWQPIGDANVTYDVIVYKGTYVGSFARELVVGPEVYYVEDIPGTEHRIGIQLEPDTPYLWAVRKRKGQSVSPWSSYGVSAVGGYVLIHYSSTTGMLFRFCTPKQ
jgi:hypothetical protein